MERARSTTETHRVIEGRRWRVSDPELPEPVRQELVDELMHARRAVKAALGAGDDIGESDARARVGAAKVALGERGPKWWEPFVESDVTVRAAALRRTLERARGTTVDDDEISSLVAGTIDA